MQGRSDRGCYYDTVLKLGKALKLCPISDKLSREENIEIIWSIDNSIPKHYVSKHVNDHFDIQADLASMGPIPSYDPKLLDGIPDKRLTYLSSAYRNMIMGKRVDISSFTPNDAFIEATSHSAEDNIKYNRDPNMLSPVD